MDSHAFGLDTVKFCMGNGREDMDVRKLAPQEHQRALQLAWMVFDEFEAPDYSIQGTDTFHEAICDPSYTGQLVCYGAFEQDELIGMLATRNGGNHIALFFVAGAYHRQGVGRKLFALACRDNRSGQLTVNAAPYSLEIYRHLGFYATDAEQLEKGMRYTPMRYRIAPAVCSCIRKRCARHGDCAACRAYHHASERKPLTKCEQPEKRPRRWRP